VGLREEKKKETRNALIAKAGTLFAAKGYQHVTTSEIARAAGIAEGTLFNYFKTKGDLFLAAVMPDRPEEAPLPAAMDDVHPAALAEAIVRVLDRELAQLAHVRKALLQDYFAVVYGGGLSEGLHARSSLFAADERMLRSVSDLLHAQKQAHPTRLAALDVDMAVACIFGCVASLLSQYILMEQLRYEELKKSMFDQIRFLLTGHVS